MRHALLLILDVPEGVAPVLDFLAPCGHWQVPSALAAADLATVLTGVPAAAHGVLDEWELRPDGQELRAAPRHRLMHQPWWEGTPGAIAVGLPWSTGSEGPARSVSAEFAEAATAGAYAPLPGRVWPPSDGPALAALRIAPDELDAATMAQLGYPPSRLAQHELASWLSLHMCATAQIAQSPAPLAVVRLKLAAAPAHPEATADFIAASMRRYRALWPATIVAVLRTAKHEHTECALFSDAGGAPIGDAASLALFMTATPARGIDMPQTHWKALRERYQAPAQAMPGAGAAIKALQARVKQALQVLGL